MALSSIVQLLCETQPSGVLAVTPVNDIAECMNTFLRIVIEPNSTPRFAIDQGYLFTSAQVLNCFRAVCRRHTVSDAATIAAAVEAEDQAGLFRSSAVHERIDAEGTMSSDEACIASIKKIEAGAPHQGPIGEDPEVLIALTGSRVHRGREGTRQLEGRL